MANIAKMFRSFKGKAEDVKRSIDQELNVSDVRNEAMEYRYKYESMKSRTTDNISNILLDDEDDKIKPKQRVDTTDTKSEGK
jgi:sec-independent protein translocase protein TatB